MEVATKDSMEGFAETDTEFASSLTIPSFVFVLLLLLLPSSPAWSISAAAAASSMSNSSTSPGVVQSKSMRSITKSRASTVQRSLPLLIVVLFAISSLLFNVHGVVIHRGVAIPT